MNSNQLPILYANDTCPYVLRARMALDYAGIDVKHREIDFDNKPPSMIKASPKATTPTLVFDDGRVIDESWDIIKWAMGEYDPDNWVGENNFALKKSEDLVALNDGDFGDYSYYYRYAKDYPDRSQIKDRQDAESFLNLLEASLSNQDYLCGNEMSVADIAIFPFIQQHSTVEPQWFAESHGSLRNWLDRILASRLYKSVDVEHEIWKFN